MFAIKIIITVKMMSIIRIVCPEYDYQWQMIIILMPTDLQMMAITYLCLLKQRIHHLPDP